MTFPNTQEIRNRNSDEISGNWKGHLLSLRLISRLHFSGQNQPKYGELPRRAFGEYGPLYLFTSAVLNLRKHSHSQGPLWSLLHELKRFRCHIIA